MCVPPEHPKAIRSGMGCIETLGWEKMNLEELEAFAGSKQIPIFVLETGGTPVNEFQFPDKGICIIGSEELGVSPQALDKAKYGRVTIPMKGLKASLNVGVAWGILMEKWMEELEKKSEYKIYFQYRKGLTFENHRLQFSEAGPFFCNFIMQIKFQ